MDISRIKQLAGLAPLEMIDKKKQLKEAWEDEYGQGNMPDADEASQDDLLDDQEDELNSYDPEDDLDDEVVQQDGEFAPASGPVDRSHTRPKLAQSEVRKAAQAIARMRGADVPGAPATPSVDMDFELPLAADAGSDPRPGMAPLSVPGVDGQARGSKSAQAREFLAANPGVSRSDFIKTAVDKFGMTPLSASSFLHAHKKRTAPADGTASPVSADAATGAAPASGVRPGSKTDLALQILQMNPMMSRKEFIQKAAEIGMSPLHANAVMYSPKAKAIKSAAQSTNPATVAAAEDMRIEYYVLKSVGGKVLAESSTYDLPFYSDMNMMDDIFEPRSFVTERDAQIVADKLAIRGHKFQAVQITCEE